MHISWRSGVGTVALLAALGGAIVAGGTAQAATPASDPGADFTSCMRANGVPGFPAATISGDGVVRLEPGGGARFDPFSESYRAALRTCAKHLPAGSTMPADPVPPIAPSITDPAVPECAGTWCPTRPVAPAAPAAPTLR